MHSRATIDHALQLIFRGTFSFTANYYIGTLELKGSLLSTSSRQLASSSLSLHIIKSKYYMFHGSPWKSTCTHKNSYKPAVEANTAHWRLPVLQLKFSLLLPPSVESSNLLPSVRSSISFPFVIEDKVMACNNLIERKRLEASGRIASTSKFVGRCGRKWK